MYKFRNVTTEDSFRNRLDWCKQTIQEVNYPSKSKREWNIRDRFGNEWNLVYDSKTEQWKIFNVCNRPCDIPFNVRFLSDGREIEILDVQRANKHYKADRFLKQFSELVTMANSYILFGYIAA